jgi:hypothetical protein
MIFSRWLDFREAFEGVSYEEGVEVVNWELDWRGDWCDFRVQLPSGWWIISWTVRLPGTIAS